MNAGAALATLALHAAAWEALVLFPRTPPTRKTAVSVSVVYRKPAPAALAPLVAAPAPAPRARKRRRRPASSKPKPVAAPPPALLTAPAASAGAGVQVAVSTDPVPAGLPRLSEEALPEGYVQENGYAFAPLYRVTQPPRLLKPLELKYPERAREFQKEGVVILEVDVDAQGRVISARVVEEPGWGFGEAALKAIREAVFTPARIGETAVPVRYRVPIRFKMDFS